MNDYELFETIGEIVEYSIGDKVRIKDCYSKRINKNKIVLFGTSSIGIIKDINFKESQLNNFPIEVQYIVEFINGRQKGDKFPFSGACLEKIDE